MAGKPRQRFIFACGFEASLLVVAAAIASLAGTPLLGGLAWDPAGAALGLGAIVPMLLVPWWVLRSDLAPARELRRLVLEDVAPFFDGWRAHEVVALSVLAGVAEEILFRAVVQGALAGPLGGVGALLAASAVFGLAHAVTWLYAVLAALVGVYLGALWMLTGNLLAPVVAHAGYDAIALLWLAAVRGARPASSPP